MPSANRKFWEAKLARNVERYRENRRALEAAGWVVLRFYEHVPATDAATVIRRAVTES
jgi:DNA mismatch endonuclease, patch repair protein